MKHYKPTFRCEIKGIAETQNLSIEQDTKETKAGIVTTAGEVTGYKVKASPRLLDRWLDTVVRIAGSAPVFCFIVGALLVWAFLGIRFGKSAKWTAVISDVQAILCYVFDSFLMRQLLREYSEQQEAMAEMKSRRSSHERMLGKLKNKLGSEGVHRVSQISSNRPLDALDQGTRTQGWFARMIIFSAWVFGHIITVGMYWVCIFIWLGFGHYCGWTDQWQLYINSATSALMVLVFAFLDCLRECYADYVNNCLDAIFRLDATLEKELRCITDDHLPNESEVIQPPRENPLQVAVFYYADIIGTLVGIMILVAVIVAWAAVGPVFHFNDNWWLLIGTYAGLIGLFDSFILRNIQGKVKEYTVCQVQSLEKRDMTLFAKTQMAIPPKDNLDTSSVTHRISIAMGNVCSHLLMVVAGFLLTIGCVIGSSAMRWSTTGQLISNIPPSIIETFFMLILITGQNDADASARVDMTNIYHRRQRLLWFVKDAREYLAVPPESEGLAEKDGN
ncbi:Low affinity iron permease-domain-containing protein [Aspergillus sergii]|uniref:Low affinity iron permease-domain-containing protein n=1 Tax=Aspergillus sergii TaxID=1034303 RepID=A0A5N6WMQ1_9EURO|nr:Low affinity iron permease-domain-containing protein [Aspergillus sergii]